MKEAMYQEMTFGHDEPEIMYLLGSTLKEMARQLGSEPWEDSEGRAILDDEMYEMTKNGIFRLD